VQTPPPKVFVSSTWLDLQPERKAVETAIRRMTTPAFVGMEYFGSRDETTQQASLDEVDRSDIYIGIFAARYGSGITEAEYRRARERNLPCFIYFKAESAITLDKYESKQTQRRRLNKLKEELRQTRVIAEFDNPNDLALKVAVDLHRWVVDNYLSSIPAVIPSTQRRPLRVFLCHASDDKGDVRVLYQRLRIDGVEPWFDEEDLLPGHYWEHEIRKAVRNSDAVIVCLSPESVNKEGFIQKEIRMALDAAAEKPEDVIFLIPLKLKECNVPERLNFYQWVNYYEEGGYERLKKSLRERAISLGLSPPT
jgi:hypothetical protein